VRDDFERIWTELEGLRVDAGGSTWASRSTSELA